MRTILTLFVVLAIANISAAQEKGTLRLSGDGYNFELTIHASENLQIAINEEGKLLFRTKGQGVYKYYTAFGDGTNGNLREIDDMEFEYYFDFNNRGKVAAVDGVKLQYYGPNTGELDAGKVQFIGATEITYYKRVDRPEKAGKIATIGDIDCDYFLGPVLQGNLRSFGGMTFTYENLTNNPNTGKLLNVSGSETGIKLVVDLIQGPVDN